MKTHRMTGKMEPFKYSSSDKSFSDAKTKCVRERSHARHNSFPCPFCDYISTTKSYLNIHLRRHTGEKPFRCDICDKSFRISSVLGIHKGIHLEEKPFPCKICRKTFTTAHSLKTHKISHLEVKPFPCKICCNTYGTAHALKSHQRTHLEEKPFPCGTCNKAFNTEFLRRHHHASSHLDTSANWPDELHCKVCNYVAYWKSDLHIHIRRHTGEKPFRCNRCSKSFNQPYDLKIHTRRHTGDKPFRCSLCPKSFNQSYDLKIHTRIHTGENPYCCKICGKKFPRSNSLSNHVLNHTKESFACQVCSLRCKSRWSFYAHMKSHAQKDEQAKAELDLNNNGTTTPIQSVVKSEEIKLLPGQSRDKIWATKSLLKGHEIHTREKPLKCPRFKSTTTGNGKYHPLTEKAEKPYKCERRLVENRSLGKNKTVCLRLNLNYGQNGALRRSTRINNAQIKPLNEKTASLECERKCLCVYSNERCSLCSTVYVSL